MKRLTATVLFLVSAQAMATGSPACFAGPLDRPSPIIGPVFNTDGQLTGPCARISICSSATPPPSAEAISCRDAEMMPCLFIETMPVPEKSAAEDAGAALRTEEEIVAMVKQASQERNGLPGVLRQISEGIRVQCSQIRANGGSIVLQSFGLELDLKTPSPDDPMPPGMQSLSVTGMIKSDTAAANRMIADLENEKGLSDAKKNSEISEKESALRSFIADLAKIDVNSQDIENHVPTCRKQSGF